MKRAAIIVSTAALAAGAAWWWSRVRNVQAFAALVRRAEANGDYSIIAGGDHFTDFSEHPFVLDPNRPRPLGTTASGGYQMVRGTWLIARDFGDKLPDFTPASQDVAFERLLRYKVPGQNRMNPDGTGIYELVAGGQFDAAISALGTEWESFAKMMAGRYHLTMADARAIIEAQGGTYAAA